VRWSKKRREKRAESIKHNLEVSEVGKGKIAEVSPPPAEEIRVFKKRGIW